MHRTHPTLATDLGATARNTRTGTRTNTRTGTPNGHRIAALALALVATLATMQSIDALASRDLGQTLAARTVGQVVAATAALRASSRRG